MLRIVVLEGPRGAGKSTVARLLRSAVEGSTLINLTGFKEDGDTGLKKIRMYYKSLHMYLELLSTSNEDFTIIFDRTFFSEMVYSPLYKSYDFTTLYDYYCKDLLRVADTLDIYFLTVWDRDILGERLTRDKVALFGHVEESIDQSLSQQRSYQQLFDNFIDMYGEHSYMNLYKIDTSHMTPEEIRNSIIKE